MDIPTAQRETRIVYLGGLVGQIVSGMIWLCSAGLSAFVSARAGILGLVFGGMFIFPLTQLILRISGRTGSLSKDNPLRELAIEVAMIVPVLLPLVGAATVHRTAWFYPAMMLVVGAHYLPFSFLYGMRQFIALAAILIVGGLIIGMAWPGYATGGAVLAGGAMCVFGWLGWLSARRDLATSGE